MNVEKRYCQNRVRKRKKFDKLIFEDKESALEEERQFKLSRFVKDISRFVEEKKSKSNYENHDCNEVVTKPEKIHVDCIRNTQNLNTTKSLASLVVKRGLFQNGIQTKFHTRGYLEKDVTARLDENLQQIIALANKEKKDDRCSHHYGFPTLHCTTSNALAEDSEQSTCKQRNELRRQGTKEKTPILARVSPDVLYEDFHLNNIHNSVTNKITEHKSKQPLVKLDTKLYSEFTRIVTVSSSQSKSIHFKKKSYGYAVKKRLLDIYQQGKRGGIEEFSISTDVHKSSVATSPLQIPSTPGTDNSEPSFGNIHFIPRPLKSTHQFLEETIPGPGPSCNTFEDSPEQQWGSSSQSSFRNKQPESLRPDSLRVLEYLHFPRINNSPLLFSPHAAITEITFDGGGDCLPLKPLNHLSLSQMEEDSPQFQYFTRRMF